MECLLVQRKTLLTCWRISLQVKADFWNWRLMFPGSLGALILCLWLVAAMFSWAWRTKRLWFVNILSCPYTLVCILLTQFFLNTLSEDSSGYVLILQYWRANTVVLQQWLSLYDASYCFELPRKSSSGINLSWCFWQPYKILQRIWVFSPSLSFIKLIFSYLCFWCSSCSLYAVRRNAR